MKNMPRFILPVLLFAAGTAGPLAVPVQAQQVSSFEGSSQGRGTLTVSNSRYVIRSVRLNLDTNGRMSARIRTNNDDYDVSGTWKSGRTDIDIQLERFNGRETLTGRANATLDRQGNGYRLAKFEIDGNVLRRGEILRLNGNFELDGNSSGGGWGGGGGSNWDSDLALNVNGSGYWTQAGKPGQNLRAMKVGLSRNGSAQLEIYLDRTYVIDGTWRQNGNWADIDINRLNGLTASGQARVQLRGRTVRKVTANGSGTGGRFSLEFDVLGDGPGPWPGDNNGDFTTSGRGIIRMPGNEDGFTSARVQFYGGDDVRIELRGPRSYTFTGTYRKQGNDYKINVTGRVGDQNAAGRGEVVLRGRQIRTIHIRGRVNNGDYNVDFDG